MGLETTQYISGLNAAWPLAGDSKSQGDDHLRLLKSVLQVTFPNASKAYYLPSAEAFSSTITLDATDQNNFVMVDCTAGDVACTLPASLTAADKGWKCDILRTNLSGLNGVVVSAASGNINSAVGTTATVRVERVYQPATFVWSGTGWFCYKSGDPIGSSMNWDSATTPPGYRPADGTTYSTTTFAEYNALRGTATLPDKRGRVEAGIDNGSVNRLTATYFGTASILGAVGGGESNNVILTHNHTGSTGNDTPDHSHFYYEPTSPSNGTGGGGFVTVMDRTGASTGGASVRHTHSVTVTNTGSAAAHKVVQPTLITNKLICIC